MASSTESLPEGLYTFTHIIGKKYPQMISAKGNYQQLDDGRKIFDACGGAAVTSIGYGNLEVIEAIQKIALTGVSYVPSALYSHPSIEALSKELIKSTNYKMGKVYYTLSGSDGTEAAIKITRQYFWEQKKLERVNYISREGSYHGNTLAALSLSGFPSRKVPYIPLLMENIHHVSSCYSYRQQKTDTDSQFVATKARELEDKFKELGPESVAAFIMEPVVGGALGCVTSPPGYLQAMKDVCHRYGALIIFDEVMCGIGRTGFLHAWQMENVVPDIQIIGKGLTGGYASMSAVMLTPEVNKVFLEGSQERIHGLTFDAMPIQATAALQVLKIINDDDLMSNVNEQGKLLEKMLKETFSIHPNVGDIRGRGLFWAIEFVEDKITKKAFPPEKGVANAIVSSAHERYCMSFYSGPGDGVRADFLIIAPSYIISDKDVKLIVETLAFVVYSYFFEFHALNPVEGNKKKDQNEN